MHEWIDALQERDSAAALQELNESLTGYPPRVPSRYLYDTLGSSLYSAITVLPEYYPSRLEHHILRTQREDISDSMDDIDTLIDLGPGDGSKALQLLNVPQLASKLRRYIGVDVSRECLWQAVRQISQRFERLAVTGLVADFSSGLAWPGWIDLGHPLMFFAGSSIGNFSPDEAAHFLHGLCRICCNSRHGRSDLLIGVDLVKPKALMEAAYDDALGVTACFNRNVLLHLNRVLKADFDLGRFRHRAYFDVRHSRIEMSLECTATQWVSWPNGGRRFTEGERLLTEYSYKYTPEHFEQLLKRSGFTLRRRWFDDSRGYMLCLASSHDGCRGDELS